MVVLVVCGSGHDAAKTAEWGALAAAFLAAGAQTVVAALADVRADQAVEQIAELLTAGGSDGREIARILAAQQQASLLETNATRTLLAPKESFLFQVFCLA